MDGRVFEVSEAARVLDMLEGSEDPSLIKDLRPIITEPQRGPSSSIPTRMPPLHPHCRCRVVMEIEERQMPVTVESPAWAPKGILQRELEDEFKALSPQEIANRIKVHQGSDWLRPASGGKGVNAYKEAKKNLDTHFQKHGGEFGFKNIEEYRNATYEIIRSPDNVYVEKSGKEIFYIFKKGDKIAVSSDDSLRIVTFFKLNKPFEQWVKERQRDGFIKIL